MAAKGTLLVVALALAGACASTHYDRLAPEAAIPGLAALGAAADGLQGARGFVTVGEADGEPRRLHYRHIPGENGEWLVVFLHGVMADSRTWRYVVGAMDGEHDLLLVDLLGCGESDKPDPDDLPPDAFSPDAMARRTLLVIRARVREGQRVAVVGHSLGSLVILRMLGSPEIRDEFPEEIAWIERAVLLSAVDFAISSPQPEFVKIAQLTPIEVALGGLIGLLPEQPARAFWDGSGDPTRLPVEAVDNFVHVLEDANLRACAQAQLRQAIPLADEGHLDRDRIDVLVSEYRNVRVPCLLLSGDRDATVPCAAAYKVRAQLPQAWLHVLPGRGHSLPTEAPEEVAAWIRDFIETAGEGLPRVSDGLVADAEPRRGGSGRSPGGEAPESPDRTGTGLE